MRALPSFLALACVIASAEACGGATPTDLFAAPTGGADASVDSSPGTVMDASTAAMDVNLPPTVDSSVSPPPDTAPPPMMGADTGPPTPQNLPCGQGQPECPVGPEEVCCISGQVPNTNFECTDQNMCSGSQGVPISCSTPAQCPGQTCCGTETGTGQNTHYVGVQCQTTCNGVEFCDPATSASTCKSGTSCMESELLPGYFVCR